MAYTLLAIKTEVGASFDTVAASSGRVTTFINDAVTEILAMRRWSWLESLGTFASVSGQADYVLVGTSPVVTDFDTMISVRHNQAAAGTTFPKLNFMKQQQFDELLGAAGATPGIPIFYTIRGGAAQATSGAVLAGGFQTLSVWPVPNFVGSFKVSYVRQMGAIELAADTDIPLPPAGFRAAITDLAISIGKARTDQLIASNVAGARADAALQRLVAADILNRTGDPQDPVDLPPNAPPVSGPGASPYGWEQGE
jgi:hypothetical protein